jgi:hypothetical protein
MWGLKNKFIALFITFLIVMAGFGVGSAVAANSIGDNSGSDNSTIDDNSFSGYSVDNTDVGDDSVSVDSVSDNSVDDKVVDDKAVDDKIIDDKAVDDKTVDDKTVYKKVEDLYMQLDIPVRYKVDNVPSFLYAIRRDKKNIENINFVLMEDIGVCKIKVPVSEHEIIWAVENSISKEVKVLNGL